MSWNVEAVGRPKAVAVKLAAEFARITCNEPEETIKNTVASAVATALAAFPDGSAVKVKAYGSQSRQEGGSGDLPLAVNSLSVSIEPLYGFAE